MFRLLITVLTYMYVRYLLGIIDLREPKMMHLMFAKQLYIFIKQCFMFVKQFSNVYQTIVYVYQTVFHVCQTLSKCLSNNCIAFSNSLECLSLAYTVDICQTPSNTYQR